MNSFLDLKAGLNFKKLNSFNREGGAWLRGAPPLAKDYNSTKYLGENVRSVTFTPVILFILYDLIALVVAVPLVNSWTYKSSAPVFGRFIE